MKFPLLMPVLVALVSLTKISAQDARVLAPHLLDLGTGETYGFPILREGRPGEEALVGANRQPEWTTARRFTTTRIYVMAPWQVEVEQWWKGKFPRHGGAAENLFQSEIEIGLPGRFQVDLYENFTADANHRVRHSGNQVELRWALAEWGKIPLNPTIYGEWKFNENGADAYEVKLLLGEELAPRWHWGFNVFYEQEVGGTRATEMGFSQAISYTVIDQKFSAGIEMNFEHVTERHSRSEPEVEFLIGPSFQFRPTPRMHLDIVPLFGTTGDSPKVEMFAIFGIDFGPGGNEGHAPVSTQAR